MKLLFTGTDVLLLNTYPAQLPWYKIFYVWLFRWFVRISKFCTEEYIVVHDHLIPELQQFGLKKIVVMQHPYNTTVYEKKPHEGFNVLYYCPAGLKKYETRFNEWLYGYDIYIRLYYHYRDTDVKFILLDGSQDMNEIMPVVDFYLRPNRHDGGARMIDECVIQEIPYYWSYENPKFTEIINAIEKVRNHGRD